MSNTVIVKETEVRTFRLDVDLLKEAYDKTDFVQGSEEEIALINEFVSECYMSEHANAAKLLTSDSDSDWARE